MRKSHDKAKVIVITKHRQFATETGRNAEGIKKRNQRQ